ncbi:MAG: chemotaxis protein CheA [Methanomassiliicoccales archaeon]|nr:MAG: chemotaxis protein CheA [Methanomassiliicoccales archaeon]
MDRSSYLEAFIEEVKENLEAVNKMLLQIEETGYDDGAMNEAYRLLHTVKGTAGVVGVLPVQEVAHIMEDHLDVLRSEKRSPPKELMDMFFKALDTIERMISELEEGSNIVTDASDIVSKLKECKGTATLDISPEKSGAHETSRLVLTDEMAIEAERASKEGKVPHLVKITFEADLKMREGRAYQLRKKISEKGDLIAMMPEMGSVNDETSEMEFLVATRCEADELRRIAMDVIGVYDSKVTRMEQVQPIRKEANGQCDVKEQPGSSSTTIRVKSKLLDQMLDLVGEIMINNIRVNQIASNLKNRELKQSLQNNARLMTQMQEIVLRTRMVPVDFIFKRFPRMVRDICNDLGKDVDFVMKGTDIEIDRALLDRIGEALVHILRNAVDHGIERPDQRVASGKRPKGSLILSAFQEQSNVIITIEDDGKGLDYKKIAAKAVEKGLVHEEEVAVMDEKEILNFIFLPGFSTADKVTSVSGRGVGLDVVRTKIEGMGGFVKVESQPGKGTKFTLRLPPSMSIIRAMLVEINQEKYAIPLDNVRETVKVPVDSIREFAGNGMFRLRDEVLPVLSVEEEFGGTRSEGHDVSAVIVEKNDSRGCLIVSKLIGQQEIVVKNVDRSLRSTGFFSGATILGDGKVAMILDVGAFL